MEYEFDNSQNQVIEQLAHKMRFCGIFLIIVGVIIALPGVLTLSGILIMPGIALPGLTLLIAAMYFLNALFYIVVGMWTVKAASSFKLIVDTTGNDISHLMNALGELKKLYTLQYTLLIIGIIGIVLLVIASVVLLIIFS